MNFADVIKMLENYGLLDVLLPFLLIFTIAFAVLQKSNILGDSKKPFNKVIALVLALAVIVPHVMDRYPPGADVVVIINSSLPNVSLLMVAGMMVLLLIGVFGKDVNIAGTGLDGIVTFAAIVSVILIFMGSAGWLGAPPSWLSWLFDEETLSLVIILLAFGLIVSFITREEEPEKKRKNFFDWFKGASGGGGNHGN